MVEHGLGNRACTCRRIDRLHVTCYRFAFWKPEPAKRQVFKAPREPNMVYSIKENTAKQIILRIPSVLVYIVCENPLYGSSEHNPKHNNEHNTKPPNDKMG